MDDKVLRFPGAQPEPAPQAGGLGIPGLSADQEKAVQLALSGRSFVMVALEESEDGADFFTAVHGKSEELRRAQPHLDGVIDRALGRKGL